MHNSTAQENKQESMHTKGLIIPREADIDYTDMEIAENIDGTMGDTSKGNSHKERDDSQERYFDISDKPKEM